ncbi:GbsR/MarR family transcriptional regulator [Actinophytocola gossypii]|uniref:MarR family transcriptional regulator n=1 Tax=Actinophytocola gossypii TaxID=2812003 RepID=A0ABT2JJQ9_9PSEU|nr:MarR family transcriptional regulator [Actinophytocola gossypii]MCT2587973.1 MarR family transcriptional regulator [Actinophytocola gossypii]
MSATHSTARQEFVEDAGLFFERLGLSRTSGRVLGWLLTHPDGSADAPELVDELAVAKSSMSVALRQLDAAGLVERYRPPRQRRDRYRLTEDVFGRAFRAKMAEFDAVHALVTRGLAVVGSDPVPRQRLQRMADMYSFMAREFPKLLDRWNREQRLSRDTC